MFDKIKSKLFEWKQHKNYKKRSRDWNFKNEKEFLKYCESTSIETLESQYYIMSEKSLAEYRKLERKIKEVASQKTISIKHLKILMSIIEKNSDNDENAFNSDVLYDGIINYFIKICEEKHEKFTHIELFYELYSFNLEKPSKIKDLVSRYLLSVGKLDV